MTNYIELFIGQMRESPQNGKVIVHIPAKSTSTRIPQKNIKPLNGLPLIAYTVKLASKLKKIDKIFIDSDDERIGKLAARYGEVLFVQRPKDLAKEKSPLNQVTQSFFSYLAQNGIQPSAIITLYPTSPFRNLHSTQHLVDAIGSYNKIYTAAPFTFNETDLLHDKQTNGRLSLLSREEPQNIDCFKLTGHFMAKSFLVPWGEKESYMKVQYLSSPLECIDLDELSDWEFAEFVCSRGLFDFGFGMTS